jgi:hypothetical protein
MTEHMAVAAAADLVTLGLVTSTTRSILKGSKTESSEMKKRHEKYGEKSQARGQNVAAAAPAGSSASTGTACSPIDI